MVNLRFWLAFLGLWTGAMALLGLDVQVVPDRSYIEAGETFGLQIVIPGQQGTTAPPLPAMPGVRYQYRGPATQMEMINGQTSVQVTHRYLLKPDTTNDVVIPSLSFRVGTQPVHTAPVRVTVLPAETHTEPAWLKLIVPRDHCVVGESFPVELQLYFQSIRDPEQPRFSLDGFLLGRSPQPVQAATARGDQSWSVVIWRFAATATKVGTLAIGPAEMDVTLLSGRAVRTGSLFDEIFAAPRDMKRVTLKSPAAKVVVTSPPRVGQPSGFAGAVGHYTLSGSVSAREVTVGDPVALRLEVTGSGSLELLDLAPLPESPEFRAYAGTNKFEPTDALGFEGRKTFEYVVVPEKSGVLRLPVPPLVFYDPVKREYGTAPAPELTLKVRPSAVGQALPTAQPSLTSAGGPAVADMAAPQWRAQRSTRPWAGVGWGARPWVAAAALSPWAGWGAVLAVGWVQRRRRAAAVRTPQELQAAELAQLTRRLSEPGAGFAEAGRAVRLRLALGLGRSPDAITGEVVDRDLIPRGLESGLCADLRGFFERLDAHHFGGATAVEAGIAARDALALLARLDQEGKC